jgi:hypothetical protein
MLLGSRFRTTCGDEKFQLNKLLFRVQKPLFPEEIASDAQPHTGARPTIAASYGPEVGREVKMRREISEQQILEFAKSYLSEAFPNPQRIGSPSNRELIEMSERPNEAKHASISEHLEFCSPCFNRYMEILGELKRRMREQEGP